jgi:hypothetical protein
VAEAEAGVDSGSGNRQSAVLTMAVVTGRVESGGDIESFGMKSKMTRGGLLFIGSKISAMVLV